MPPFFLLKYRGGGWLAGCRSLVSSDFPFRQRIIVGYPRTASKAKAKTRAKAKAPLSRKCPLLREALNNIYVPSVML